MRLIIFRHGQTEANVARVNQGQSDGGVLTKEGRRQAQLLAEALKDEKIDAIYCSDLARAKDTLAPLLGRTDAPVHYLPELRDMHMGTFEGKPLGLRSAYLKQNEQEFWTVKPGTDGESYEEVHRRITSLLDSIIAKHPKDTVVLVSHADPIGHMHAHLLKKKPDEFFDIRPTNTGLTIVDIEGEKITFQKMASTEHLS